MRPHSLGRGQIREMARDQSELTWLGRGSDRRRLASSWLPKGAVWPASDGSGGEAIWDRSFERAGIESF